MTNADLILPAMLRYGRFVLRILQCGEPFATVVGGDVFPNLAARESGAAIARAPDERLLPVQLPFARAALNAGEWEMWEYLEVGPTIKQGDDWIWSRVSERRLIDSDFLWPPHRMPACLSAMSNETANALKG